MALPSDAAGGSESAEFDFDYDFDDTKSEEGNSTEQPESPSKVDGSAQYDEEMFGEVGNAEERCTTLDEFWKIANKTFQTEDEAFCFYNSYARDKGFTVRREKVGRAKHSGALLFRRFVCGREGERQAKFLNTDSISRRPRALTRCHCPALLDIRLDRSSGLWYVGNFIDDHNHCLTMPDEAPFLWSQRKMKDFQKTEIMSMEAVGIRKHVIMDVLQCRYGGYDKVGIVRKDIYNYSSRYKRSRIAGGDASTILGLMQRRQKSDPDFYFDYQLDARGRLKNMFWCDTQSRLDYQSFGDVVVFDSTYRMNRYKMPFVPFVGLNHHRITTVFGCGIVSDERVESYVWLIRAFLKAMCQQKPQSIITDGDVSMMSAIRRMLPGVNHRICTWHVEKNLPKHVHYKSLDAFRSLIYNACSPAIFEEKWNAFLENNQTSRNKDWLTMMYKNKKLWAAAFQFEKFFPGMRSNQRSESLNSSLHRHLDYYMSLLDLVEHYENCVSRLCESEAELDCVASQSLPVPLTKYKEIEVSGSRIFTAANFYKFQVELVQIDDFQIFETLVGIDSHRFIVARKEKKRSLYLMDYSSASSEINMRCSCRKMEREGLPCKHILHVLDHMKHSEIPKCCVLQRHTKVAKSGLPSRRKSSIYGWTTKRARYSELTGLGAEAFDVASKSHEEFSNVQDYLRALISKKHRPEYGGSDGQSSGDLPDQTCHSTIGNVLDPAVVATKGAPRKNSKWATKENVNDGKRYKSFGEKRKYKCSKCKQAGHNSRRCEMQKENRGSEGAEHSCYRCDVDKEILFGSDVHTEAEQKKTM